MAQKGTGNTAGEVVKCPHEHSKLLVSQEMKCAQRKPLFMGKKAHVKEMSCILSQATLQLKHNNVEKLFRIPNKNK